MDFDDLFDQNSHRGRRRGREDHDGHQARSDRDGHGERDGHSQLELGDRGHGQVEPGQDRQALGHHGWGADGRDDRRGSDHHDDESDAWGLGQGRRHGEGELLRWLATGPLRSTGARVLAGVAAVVVLLLLGALIVGALRLAGQLPLEGLAAPAVEAARSVLMGK
jgi:hypothetical protein